jgi:hypothetical protein
MTAQDPEGRLDRSACRGSSRREPRARARRLTAAGAALAMLGLVAFAMGPAQAADAHDFNAGMIIADEVFFAPGALTAGEVQSFLED